MFRSSLADACSDQPMTELSTMAASATQIIGPLSTGSGECSRRIASYRMMPAITTRPVALTSAARIPTRW